MLIQLVVLNSCDRELYWKDYDQAEDTILKAGKNLVFGQEVWKVKWIRLVRTKDDHFVQALLRKVS